MKSLYYATLQSTHLHFNFYYNLYFWFWFWLVSKVLLIFTLMFIPVLFLFLFSIIFVFIFIMIIKSISTFKLLVYFLIFTSYVAHHTWHNRHLTSCITCYKWYEIHYTWQTVHNTLRTLTLTVFDEIRSTAKTHRITNPPIPLLPGESISLHLLLSFLFHLSSPLPLISSTLLLTPSPLSSFLSLFIISSLTHSLTHSLTLSLTSHYCMSADQRNTPHCSHKFFLYFIHKTSGSLGRPGKTLFKELLFVDSFVVTHILKDFYIRTLINCDVFFFLFIFFSPTVSFFPQ